MNANGEFDYCEHQFLLSKQKIVTQNAEENAALVEGRRIHASLDSEFLVNASNRIDWEQFIKSRRRLVTRPSADKNLLYAQLGEVLLVGEPDELASDASGIYVVDDKPRFEAYDGYKNQVRAYCAIVEEMFKDDLVECRKPVYGMIRNRESGEVYWRERFDRIYLLFEIRLQELVETLKGKRLPLTANNPKKCAACSRNNSCGYSLAKN